MTIAKMMLSLAIALGAAGSAHAGVTYTSTSNGANLRFLGVPDTTTYGEVFTAPTNGNTRLDSFSFFIEGNLVRAYGGVATWSGAGAGADLFKSTYFGATYGTFTEVTVDTGGLDLNAGEQYVAYFSAYGVEEAGEDLMELGTRSAVQNGAVWDNANGRAPNHDNWDGAQLDPANNAAGSMTFSIVPVVPVNVPEPGSLALMGLGLGAAGLLRARRRKGA